MSKKYIYANIRLPIEMSANGSFYEVFSDRMTIDFELCKILPEPTSYENKELIAKIFAIQQEDEVEEAKIQQEQEQEEEEEAEEEKEQEQEEEEEAEQEAEQEQEPDKKDGDQKVEEEMKILKREFKHKINKSRHNLSFRKRFKRNSVNKFTRRTYT